MGKLEVLWGGTPILLPVGSPPGHGDWRWETPLWDGQGWSRPQPKSTQPPTFPGSMC